VAKPQTDLNVQDVNQIQKTGDKKMMSKPDSEMDGTICKECNRLISDHLPEELEECVRKSEFKRLKDDDMR
tara:strand:- start:135 stop:347 length:213 start_codon:yes stop_codon:yes gene_type:complete